MRRMSSWLSSTKEKLSAKARLPSSVQMKAPLPGTTTPASADQNSSFVRIRAESSGRLPKTSTCAALKTTTSVR